MGLLDWLSGGQQAAADETDVETVRRIAGELDTLPPEQARYVACFAYILGRVANADLDISADEMAAMEKLVTERAGLPAVQSTLVVHIAKQRNQLFGGTDNFLVTRTFSELADLEQKRALLDCLYAVSVADKTVCAAEDREIRLIASELQLSHAEFIRARAPYSEYLSVLQD